MVKKFIETQAFSRVQELNFHHTHRVQRIGRLRKPWTQSVWGGIALIWYWCNLEGANMMGTLGVPSVKLTVRNWKLMVGIRSFPFGEKGLFSGALAVSFREGIYYQSVEEIFQRTGRGESTWKYRSLGGLPVEPTLLLIPQYLAQLPDDHRRGALFYDII